MSPQQLKPCCQKSSDELLDYCRHCNTFLPAEVTVLRWPNAPKPVVPISLKPAPIKNSHRRWLFATVIACLAVFAAIVVADYLVQRKIARDALSLTPATQRSSSSGTSTPLPSQTPSATGTPILDSAESQVEERPTPKPTIDDLEPYLDPITPTTSRIAPTPEPAPTAALRPRYVSLIDSHDVLKPTGTQSEDTRRYRFHVEKDCRVKGSFSARGNISVRITAAGIEPPYTSGSEISADTIDVFLYAGTYEVVVSARQFVGFSLQLGSYYDPE